MCCFEGLRWCPVIKLERKDLLPPMLCQLSKDSGHLSQAAPDCRQRPSKVFICAADRPFFRRAPLRPWICRSAVCNANGKETPIFNLPSKKVAQGGREGEDRGALALLLSCAVPRGTGIGARPSTSRHSRARLKAASAEQGEFRNGRKMPASSFSHFLLSGRLSGLHFLGHWTQFYFNYYCNFCTACQIPF